MFSCVFEDICNNLYRWQWWINVSVLYYEFFENVVLNGVVKLFWFYFLFFGCDDVEGYDWDYCFVYCYGY